MQDIFIAYKEKFDILYHVLGVEVESTLDARDLKSLVGYPACRFESRPRHSICPFSSVKT